MTHPRLTTTIPAALAVALLCAGCGGGPPTVSTSTAPTSGATGRSGGSSAGSGPGVRQGRVPGVSGLVAAVDGRTLQVQGNNEQTAVTYTASTRFTHEVAATLADVRVGVCVVARDTRQRVAPGATGNPGTSGTAGASDASPIEATTVAISSPVGGRCTGGFAGAGGVFGAGRLGGGFRGGSGQSGAPGATGTQPATPPTGGPGSAGRSPGFFGGRAVVGRVTAVHGLTVTVQALAPAAFGGRTSTRTPASAPTSAPTTRAVQVTTSPTTSYTRTASTSARSAVVGVCVTALGTPDETGAVTATSIAVRPAVNGVCTGFRGRGSGTGTGAPRA